MTRHGRSCEDREGKSAVRFSEIVNEVDYTKAQYTSAMEGLIEGAVLAVFVVFLFLRDIRATAISRWPSRCRRSRLLVHEPDGDHAQLHVDCWR
jgi:hypothetical protein